MSSSEMVNGWSSELEDSDEEKMQGEITHQAEHHQRPKDACKKQKCDAKKKKVQAALLTKVKPAEKRKFAKARIQQQAALGQAALNQQPLDEDSEDSQAESDSTNCSSVSPSQTCKPKNALNTSAFEIHLEFQETGLFLSKRWRKELDHQTQEVVKQRIAKELTPAGVELLEKACLNQTTCEWFLFEPQYVNDRRRSDGILKLVSSNLLKYIVHSFLQKHKINIAYNQLSYVKRFEVNRQIFVEFFKAAPLIFDQDHKIVGIVEEGMHLEDNFEKKYEACLFEHMILFDIQSGFTDEHVSFCLGIKAGVPDRTFMGHFLSLLNQDVSGLGELYREKRESMLRAHWSLTPKELSQNRRWKLPLCIPQFESAVKTTHKRIAKMVTAIWLKPKH